MPANNKEMNFTEFLMYSCTELSKMSGNIDTGQLPERY
jgi:hypothetical protein